jgi:hypothetical protein
VLKHHSKNIEPNRKGELEKMVQGSYRVPSQVKQNND